MPKALALTSDGPLLNMWRRACVLEEIWGLISGSLPDDQEGFTCMSQTYQLTSLGIALVHIAIESIAMSSAGDIRGAVNALQFACLKGRGGGVSNLLVNKLLSIALHTVIQ